MRPATCSYPDCAETRLAVFALMDAVVHWMDSGFDADDERLADAMKRVNDLVERRRR